MQGTSVTIQFTEADLAITNKIREIARELLRKGDVEVVIGFEQGTVPLQFTPCFIRNKDQVDRLVWDSFCGNNLAKYLVKRTEKAAVVAKGCDVRAIVQLIKEKQVTREQVVIIAIPYHGMVDRKRIEAELNGMEVLSVEEKDDELVLKGKDAMKTFDKAQYLCQCCEVGPRKNPVIWDYLIGDTVIDGVDSYADVIGFAEKPAEERWDYITRQVSKCIRCYACRNACPMCYCEECFVDSTSPQWIGKTTDLSDTLIFHLTRALHLAGRCVGCGACERACPKGVDIRTLNRKLVSDVNVLFKHEAGVDLKEPAPLSTFRPDDPEDFMLNP
ncbi:4Fe-4S dicluster domain-containing protein [Chloroflexota bacterium]